MAQIDERTKVRVSQTLKKNLQKQQAWGGASTVRRRGEVSGTASSVAFTPLQVMNKFIIFEYSEDYILTILSLILSVIFESLFSGVGNCKSSSC